MRYFHHGRFQQQFRFLRHQFLQDGDLPFCNSRDDPADLCFARRNAELDLRSLKQTMQMDILRCKTPELVRKEIWTHMRMIRAIPGLPVAKASDVSFDASNKSLQRTPAV